MAKIPVKAVGENEKTVDEPIHEQEQESHETEVTSTKEASEAPPIQDIEEDGEEGAFPQEVDAEQETADEEPAEQEEAEEEEDELSRLKRQLEAKEQEAQEHYDARLRLQAEFDNFKKRKEREILEFRKYANEDFIRELLVVVDDFDRAIAAAEQSHKLEDFLQGVELIFEKFLGVLKKKGVKEIEAEGQSFNPEIHEAVMQVESNDAEEGTIVAVFQKGYYLHDRVIMAPKVSVAK